MKKLKIYLVDDHALFREGLKFLLSSLDFVEEIFEAEMGSSLFQAYRRILQILLYWISKCPS